MNHNNDKTDEFVPMDNSLSRLLQGEFVVADHSTNPADKGAAHRVIGDHYFGAHLWLRYTILWRALRFRDSLNFKCESAYVVLRVAVPNDPRPPILPAIQPSKKASLPAANSATRPLWIQSQESVKNV